MSAVMTRVIHQPQFGGNFAKTIVLTKQPKRELHLESYCKNPNPIGSANITISPDVAEHIRDVLNEMYPVAPLQSAQTATISPAPGVNGKTVPSEYSYLGKDKHEWESCGAMTDVFRFRVPGGWLYTTSDSENATFVPLPKAVELIGI